MTAESTSVSLMNWMGISLGFFFFYLMTEDKTNK